MLPIILDALPERDLQLHDSPPNNVDQEIKQQQQRIEEQQQRMEEQQQRMQQAMKEQQQTLAQQHKVYFPYFVFTFMIITTIVTASAYSTVILPYKRTLQI